MTPLLAIALLAAPAQNTKQLEHPTLGDVDAPMTLKVFCEPNTPACSYYMKHMREVSQGLPVKVQYVLLPAKGDIPSQRASRLALAARDHGGDKLFFQALDLLAKKDKHDVPTLIALSNALGLPTEMKKRVVEGYAPYDGVFLRAQDQARHAKIKYAPAFFLDGKQILRPMVEDVREHLGGR
jgi:protein-disulfide isomerase